MFLKVLQNFLIQRRFYKKKYECKYRFSYPGSKIIVERLIKEPVKQMDIFDIIKE